MIGDTNAQKKYFLITKIEEKKQQIMQSTQTDSLHIARNHGNLEVLSEYAMYLRGEPDAPKLFKLAEKLTSINVRDPDLEIINFFDKDLSFLHILMNSSNVPSIQKNATKLVIALISCGAKLNEALLQKIRDTKTLTLLSEENKDQPILFSFEHASSENLKETLNAFISITRQALDAGEAESATFLHNIWAVFKTINVRRRKLQNLPRKFRKTQKEVNQMLLEDANHYQPIMSKLLADLGEFSGIPDGLSTTVCSSSAGSEVLEDQCKNMPPSLKKYAEYIDGQNAYAVTDRKTSSIDHSWFLKAVLEGFSVSTVTRRMMQMRLFCHYSTEESGPISSATWVLENFYLHASPTERTELCERIQNSLVACITSAKNDDDIADLLLYLPRFLLLDNTALLEAALRRQHPPAGKYLVHTLIYVSSPGTVMHINPKSETLLHIAAANPFFYDGDHLISTLDWRLSFHPSVGSVEQLLAHEANGRTPKQVAAEAGHPYLFPPRSVLQRCRQYVAAIFLGLAWKVSFAVLWLAHNLSITQYPPEKTGLVQGLRAAFNANAPQTLLSYDSRYDNPAPEESQLSAPPAAFAETVCDKPDPPLQIHKKSIGSASYSPNVSKPSI